jgi:hypothetical protein
MVSTQSEMFIPDKKPEYENAERKECGQSTKRGEHAGLSDDSEIELSKTI